MFQSEVISSLAKAALFRGPWTLDDSSYEPCSPAFIAGAAQRWVTEALPDECTELRDLDVGVRRRFPRWIAEAGDCDNGAKSLANYLAECEWAKAARSGLPLGNLAAGILRFCPDDAGGQGHAVCWFVDHDGTAHVFDPGIMGERNLSPAERLSIYGGESV